MSSPDQYQTCSAPLRAIVASGDRQVIARIREAFGQGSCVELIGVAGDGLEAAQLAVVNQPDVIVVDDRLDGDGLKVCAVVNQVASRTKIVLLVEGLNEQVVMDAARAGAREILSHSFQPGQFLDAVGRLSDAEKDLLPREYEWATNPQTFPRLLIVSSAKGGSGVTSIAANLATALSLSKTGRTVLIDGNPEYRDCASLLSVSPRYGLADLAERFEEEDWNYLDQVLLQQSTSTASGLDVVVSASAEPGVPQLNVSFLSKAAQMLRRSYRYVVVDAPAYLVADFENALPTYWRLLLVGNLKDALLLQNTRRLLDYLTLAQPRSEKVGVVLNRDLKPTEFTAKDMQEVLNIPIVATVPDDQNLVRAGNLGRAAVADNPGCPAAKAISQLARNLIATAQVAVTDGQFLKAA